MPLQVSMHTLRDLSGSPVTPQCPLKERHIRRGRCMDRRSYRVLYGYKNATGTVRDKRLHLGSILLKHHHNVSCTEGLCQGPAYELLEPH
jgi:hypothetical protein